jgi:type I restriction enzyme S subunit
MSFPRYERYKDSGVEWLGEVPEHWSIMRYKLVFRERNERSESGAETLLSVSSYTGVTPRSEIIDEGDTLMRADTLEGYKICYPDDLVVNIMLAWNRGLAFSTMHGVVSPAYCVYDVISPDSPQFLNYLVRSDRAILYYKAFSSGVIDSRLRIYPDVFGSLYCALPDRDEQDAIVALLDRETAKIDALIEEQQRLIELLKEKRQAVISHAVTKGLNREVPMKYTGDRWLGSIPVHWTIVAAKFVSTIFVPQRNKPELNQEGYGTPWITMDQMKEAELAYSGNWVSHEAAEATGTRTLSKGAVIASCVGNFGSASVNLCDVVINQQLQAFIPNLRIRTAFLRYRVESAKSYFEEIGTAATIPYVNQQGFASLPISLPPLDEQDKIIAHLESVTSHTDGLIASATDAAVILQERRSALISAAVTGKIDIRNYTPKEAA